MVAAVQKDSLTRPNEFALPSILSSEPKPVQKLAQTILTSTTCQQNEAETIRGRFQGPIDQSTIAAMVRLQEIMQNPEACEKIARVNGLAMSVFSRPPRPHTPTGDFYEIVPLLDGRISLFLGDACGHDHPDPWANSLAFNLFTATSRFLMHAYPPACSAVDVLKFIDSQCNFRGSGAQDFVTVSHVLIDPKSGEFELANAFNTYPFILRSTGELDTLEVHGGPLSNPNFPIEFSQGTPDLKRGKILPGDVMLLLTDGVPDGKHTSGIDMEQALPSILRKIQGSQRHTPKSVLTAVLKGLKSTHDDIALMAFSIQGGAVTTSGA